MEVLCAAFSDNADLPARCATEFGSVVTGQNLDLLGRIHVSDPITAPFARVRTATAPSNVMTVSCERVPLIWKGTPPPTAKLKSPAVALARTPGKSPAP